MPSRTSFKSPMAVPFPLASEWTMPKKCSSLITEEAAGEEDPFCPPLPAPSLCEDGMFGAAGNHFATMRQKLKVRTYCWLMMKVCILMTLAEPMNQSQDHLLLVFLLSKQYMSLRFKPGLVGFLSFTLLFMGKRFQWQLMEYPTKINL